MNSKKIVVALGHSALGKHSRNKKKLSKTLLLQLQI